MFHDLVDGWVEESYKNGFAEGQSCIKQNLLVALRREAEINHDEGDACYELLMKIVKWTEEGVF